MVDTITLSVADEDLAEALKDCEVGEEKTLTFTVTSKDAATLSGDVSSIEGYGEEEEDYDAEEEVATPVKPSGPTEKKMPVAIEQFGSGK